MDPHIEQSNNQIVRYIISASWAPTPAHAGAAAAWTNPQPLARVYNLLASAASAILVTASALDAPC